MTMNKLGPAYRQTCFAIGRPFYFLAIFLSCFLHFQYAVAQDQPHNLAVGLGYPYLSLKWAAGPKLAFEARGAYETGISVAGGRIYYNFGGNRKFTPYTGVEYDGVSFDTGDISGNGQVILVFLGGEYPLGNAFSVCFDMDAAYASLVDSQDTGINLGDTGMLFNIGLNYYIK